MRKDSHEPTEARLIFLVILAWLLFSSKSAAPLNLFVNKLLKGFFAQREKNEHLEEGVKTASLRGFHIQLNIVWLYSF